MKWTIIKAIVVGLLSAIAVLLKLDYAPDNSAMGFVVLVLLLSGIVAIGDLAKEKLQPKLVESLAPLLNSCARDSLSITSVATFLEKTEEHQLAEGDEVHVLTNTLASYDSTVPALNVISENVKEGVKYIYYVSQSRFPALELEKSEFIGRLKNDYHVKDEVLAERIQFYVFDEECLFNFAVVQARGHVTGYWYITTPPKRGATVNSLIILTLPNDHRDVLLGVFEQLRGRSKRVSCLGRDL